MRRKRWLIVLAAIAATLLLAVWLGGRLLQPQRITGYVIAVIERASGLQVSVAQPADYAFRPTPRLRLSGVHVTDPGTSATLFDIGLLDISLPWNTLFGGDPVIRALLIEGARVEVVPLGKWLSQRPPGGTGAWPVLDDGLQVRDSRLIGDGWSARIQTLELPQFAMQTPLNLRLAASVRRDHNDPATVAVDWPFTLSIDALPRALGSGMALDLQTLKLAAASPLPTFHASGGLAFGEQLSLSLSGELAQWPAAWPPLPQPLAAATSPLAFAIKAIGSGTADLQVDASLSREQTRIAVQVPLAQLQGWLDATPGSPLPPILAQLHSDQLQIEGARLDDVSIRIEADPQP